MKKRLWYRCFCVNFTKFLRTPFLQNTSRRLLLLLAFQKQPPEVFYEKRCSWKFRKIHRKTPLVCEIFKNTFFTEHLWTTASAFSFSEATTGGVLWKKVFLKISQNSQENTFGLQNFQKHLFYRTPLDDCFWLFRATLRKWDTANSVWKTSDEYSLSRNTNLRSTVQVYHFFFRQDKLSVYVFIGLHGLLPEAAIRVEVFCKTRCS